MYIIFPPTRRIYVLVKIVTTKCITLGKQIDLIPRPDLFGELPLDKNSDLDWPGVLRLSLGCPREGKFGDLKCSLSKFQFRKTFSRGMKNRKENALVSYTAWNLLRLKPPRARVGSHNMCKDRD